MGPAELGIIPLPDGHGVVELLPEAAVGGLRFVGGRQAQGIQRPDGGSPVLAQQHLMVDPVVDQKVLILKAGAEVPPQQGKDPVLRLDLRRQDAAVVRKADEALQKMGLAVQVPDSLKDRIQRFIRGVMEEGGAFLQ